MAKKLCSIEACSNTHEARGWCKMHYRRWQKHGSPLADKPRRTLQGEARAFLEEKVLQYRGDECLTWPFAKTGTGYGQILDGGSFKIVSRVVCERLYGPPPTPSHEAAHSCGKGHLACVAKRHLSWKTPAENAADKVAHGTANRGERHYATKLTDIQVGEIRSLRGLKSQQEIAGIYGIARNTVSAIQTGANWGWANG